MSKESYERIRFSIKGPEGTYHGEVTGDGLKDRARYHVRLVTGETFEIEALHADEDRYDWITHAKEKVKHLAPVVGGIIERYFRRKGRNVE